MEMTGVVSWNESLPVLPGGSPPPLTVTLFTALGAAPAATFTVALTVVLLAPAARAVALVHATRPPPTMLSPANGEFAVHVQPAPATGTA
jgi:hypothetical protein